MLAPYANIILKTCVIFNPTIISLTIERIVCDGLRTLAGSTMGMAAMGDIVPRNELAQASANMAVCMGVGLLFSPVISSFLNPIGTCSSAVCFVYTCRRLIDLFLIAGTYKAAVVMAVIQLVTDQLLVSL